MEWYHIVSIVIGILGLFGISAYFAERMKYRAGKINKKSAEKEAEKAKQAAQLRALEHEQYKKELTAIINTAIAPIAADVAQIKSDLAKNTEGTVTLLRTDMKNATDKYKERGYASAGDRANWNELYITYDRLGGNHFREYVDGWKEEISNLPFKKETAIKRSTKGKKQILNEKR